MKVTKENSEFGLVIFLEEDEKYLTFNFCGNLDLYWSIHNKSDNINENYKYDVFIITKENYGVYRLFEELFYNIENINIFNLDDISLNFVDEEEQLEYLEKRKKEIEETKNRIRLYNISNYNELFDSVTSTITWYSDETSHKVSNILKIKKEKNKFKIEFYTQPHINGYDEDFHSLISIPIRFRNYGSSYDPFNYIFMKMYNDMDKIDDVNDIGHQFHIEEYLYNKEKSKKLIK